MVGVGSDPDGAQLYLYYLLFSDVIASVNYSWAGFVAVC